MVFFSFIDKLCWPVSVLVTIFNVLCVVAVFLLPDLSALAFFAFVFVGFFTFIYMILYMRLTYFKFIWAMISGGWKLGWNIGCAIFFIPGVHIIGALLGAMLITTFALEFCVLFLAIFPITQVIYKELICNEV